MSLLLAENIGKASQQRHSFMISQPPHLLIFRVHGRFPVCEIPFQEWKPTKCRIKRLPNKARIVKERKGNHRKRCLTRPGNGNPLTEIENQKANKRNERHIAGIEYNMPLRTGTWRQRRSHITLKLKKCMVLKRKQELSRNYLEENDLLRDVVRSFAFSVT